MNGWKLKEYITLWVFIMMAVGGIYLLVLGERNTEIGSAEYDHLINDKKEFPFINGKLYKAGKDGKITRQEYDDIHKIIQVRNEKIYMNEVMSNFSSGMEEF